MPRLTIPGRDEAPRGSQGELDAIHRRLGFVPSLFRLVALSPTVLKGFADLSSALAKTLDARTRARIAVAVVETQHCEYCVAANSFVARNIGKISPREIARNRQGASDDPRASAAVRFAVKVAEQNGHVGDDEVAAVRSAGFDDTQIVEIVAIVWEGLFATLITNVARPDMDFPNVMSP